MSLNIRVNARQVIALLDNPLAISGRGRISLHVDVLRALARGCLDPVDRLDDPDVLQAVAETLVEFEEHGGYPEMARAAIATIRDMLTKET